MTKTEAAYRTLRGWIEKGKLQPGERITVNQLSNSIRVSPTPVREAMRLLQSEGLIESKPHQGSVVAEFSVERILDIYRLRAALEPVAAKLTVENANGQQRKVIQQKHQDFERAVEANSRQAIQLNAGWHRAFAKASGSPLLDEFIDRLCTMITAQGLWASGHASLSLAQHSRVMEAFDSRDSLATAEAMREHILAGAAFTQKLRGFRPTVT